MPTVFREAGYRFFFYSNEGDPREPVHVHVQSAESESKFWIKDEVTLARSDGFDALTLRKILKIIERNKNKVEEKWYEHFGE